MMTTEWERDAIEAEQEWASTIDLDKLTFHPTLIAALANIKRDAKEADEEWTELFDEADDLSVTAAMLYGCISRIATAAHDALIHGERIEASRDAAIDRADAAHDQIEILQASLGEALEIIGLCADYDEGVADELGCDAGNFDGGSPATCEHCVVKSNVQRMREFIDRKSVLLS